MGVDLTAIQPADGLKISGVDVEAQVKQLASPKDVKAQRRIELSPVKRITGQRMTESAWTVPQFSLTIDADMRQLLAIRAAAKSAGQNLSMTILLIHLSADALQEHP